MTWTAIILAAVLICFAAIHFACACTALRWRPTARSGEPSRPKAVAILAVRGSDPTLGETIRGLIEQDYESFEVRIIVDHPSDSAWTIARQIVDEIDRDRRCHIECLVAPGTQCGLKCQAIAQVVSSLTDAEIIATLDADVAPPPNWLRDLVAPLCDPSVGAVTGNHWFEPDRSDIGSLVRSLWNAGSLIPATFFGNPWGGSCAMRLADVRQSGLIDDWQKSAVDDGPVRAALGRIGKRIVFSPAHLMVNRESCSLHFCRRYMARILTWSRAYEPTFGWTVAHAFVNVTPWIASLVLACIAGIVGHWPALGILGLGLVVHSFLLWSSYAVIRKAVRRCASGDGKSMSPLSFARGLKTFALTPLAFGMYAHCLIRALLQRYVEWRGNWYYLVRPRQVVLLSYRPFEQAESDPSRSNRHSI